MLSGFHECWEESLGWENEDFNKPNVLDIWDHRTKDKLIEQGKIKFSQFIETDINPKLDKGNNELLRVERQWMQIEKIQNNDSSVWLEKDGLKVEMNKWKYPLHFIDFETSTVAIPFNKDRHPYEGVAFQYSHHIVSEDGVIEHKGQYLNNERGIFPNYEFVRRLKEELEQDEGTIFRYHNHENTYLNMIYKQLQTEKDDVADKDELCSFIQDITKSTKDSINKWCGDRNMEDLWILVKKYYYNPSTNGSNSLKDVLPATINSSDYLKQKYSQPIYGTTKMPSLNFTKHQWLDIKENIASDPYDKLNISEFFDGADICDSQENSDGIKDGGAAMMAYAKMQFEELSSEKRDALQEALLRYCELDTLAMVMIYEAWCEWLKN